MSKHTVFFILILLLTFACSEPQRVKEENSTGLKTVEIGQHPTVSWILACRVGQGGFGCFPGDSAFVSLTSMALDALAEMGELEKLAGKEQLVAWLKNMQQPDGGFLEAPDFYNNKVLPWKTMSALEPTYWAVKALNVLGEKPEYPDKAIRFIKARQRESGAFDAWEVSWGGAKEALYSTFWAVAALRILEYPVPDSANVVEWAQSMQNTIDQRGGFRLSVDEFNFSSTSGTYYGVRILDLLGALPERPQEVKKFLLSSFGQEADGGFEIGHGDSWNNFDHYSLTQDTYMAVHTLELLGMPLSDSDISRAARPATDCAAWIGSVQNPDGGFARVGVTDQTPLASPSEMRATWQAVKAIKLLGQNVPMPEAPVAPPVSEVKLHLPLHRNPTIHNDNPADVWAYRRIALPIYSHFLEKTGSRIEALGWLSRWARAVTGPQNAVYLFGGRGLLHQGWGQCGEMTLLFGELASSVDHAIRYSFVIGDVNCEIQVTEKGWEQPHWCLFIPFTNEYPDPSVPAPDGKRNGWSVLDIIVDYNKRKKNFNYPSFTKLGDHLFNRVKIEPIDFVTGGWGEMIGMDSTTTYESPVAEKLYPDRSW